jgi:hypothetical protein
MVNYYGDTHTKQVHDLNNQKGSCEIDEIKMVHKRYFVPDTFTQANSEGYTSYIYCIEELQK